MNIDKLILALKLEWNFKELADNKLFFSTVQLINNFYDQLEKLKDENNQIQLLQVLEIFLRYKDESQLIEFDGEWFSVIVSQVSPVFYNHYTNYENSTQRFLNDYKLGSIKINLEK